MILDTSALLAVLLDEPDAPAIADAMANASRRRISVVNWVESAIVITSRRGERGAEQFRALVAKLGADIVPADSEQAEAAYAAWLAYGKGRNPAALNFGDCFAYALAKCLAEPLLFKGEDFAQTDIRAAR
jgi:ribonuclease VapC